MKLRAKKRTVVAVVSGVAAALAVVAGVQVAQADAPQHYYVEIGGTGSSLNAPDCTKTYGFANQNLGGAVAVPICYPASFGPLQGGDGTIPAPNAPRYDESVKQGVEETLKQIGDIHRNDPAATITVVGYSQGADVGDRVLEKIANGETEIPAEIMSGKLYADPRQPDTGIWAKVPAGTSIEGITSPGAGPVEFPGMTVERHCIAKDGVCDATSLDSFRGYFQDHPKYPAEGGIIPSTITAAPNNEVVWHQP
ncbi:PE-PPE domain-containing protein [Stackebrandtia nassauensis]|uniref:PE-PPE domain protein n=1 Tax=Stackebrandtia nassauensis (strain DSM 44728 / CIP 108903 / NRRL B-16338 / NBRC 102104 / LLR-40K-21) TaxID=446470 RepID=D3Q4N0_STANL|nr:PE-PPE domain-containing protein [Stackebrandtia nassauensis]ADD40190.1 PE-PPE domain protein [Stackebrandtia nassauensis DSM 44728]